VLKEQGPSRSKKVLVISRTALPSSAILALLVTFAFSAVSPPSADAAPKKCFGKKVNRVIGGKNKTVRVKFKDVTWVAGSNVTVIGKPYSRICADRGRQIIRPGKGRSLTSTGRGDDVIRLHRSSNRNIVQAGLGNDVIYGAKGHDFLYGGPKKNPSGAADRDVVNGLGGNDRIYSYSGTGDRLYGGPGSDHIYSLGSSVAELHGGNGTDFLYSNGGRDESGRLEKLFGERGNDRLRANRIPNNGPVYLDGGSGDDWLFGTPADDTAIFHSGIKKISMGAGNDLMVATSRGLATVDGGPGRDLISYATHTPPGYRELSGVMVNLAGGESIGQTRYRLSGVEDVAGSPFDDEITGAGGVDNLLQGGLGDDTLIGQSNDGDVGDGGLGTNECSGFAKSAFCGRLSPGDPTTRGQVAVDINEGGVLTVLGGNLDDRISIGYDRLAAAYRVDAPSTAVAAGNCEILSTSGRQITCAADSNSLNGVLVYGAGGNDSVTIENSVPSSVTTTINGGSGSNRLTGGQTKDFISTEGNASGSMIEGRGGLDLLYHSEGVKVEGGTGSDVLHMANPCVGGSVKGGKGKDNLVFAGANRGVEANIAGGYAKWASGRCSNAAELARDIEGLEGSPGPDRLILGPRHRSQEGKGSLLGREGADYLNSRNGRRDTVTTGGGSDRSKTVVADRKDKVVWGWGLSGF